MQKILKLQRLFKGYVTFSASNGFVDRFFDECKNYGLTVFNIKKSKGSIYADMYAKDYKRYIHKVRRSSEMKVNIVKRRGLPFFIWKRRDRLGIVLGLIFFLILTTFLSQRIWNISVVGNERINANDILDAYESEGIYVGAKNSTQSNIKEENVMDSIKDIIWTSIDNSGVSTVIKVKEGTGAPEIKTDEVPGNIIASRDGQIVKYEVYDGSSEQVVNAAVTKGDLLISGVITFTDGSVMLKPADGRVLAKTNRNIDFSLDEKFDLYSVMESKEKWNIDFFGVHISVPTLNYKSNGTIVERNYEQYLVLNNVILPIGLIKTESLLKDSNPVIENEKFVIGLNEYFKLQSLETVNSKIESNYIKVSKKHDNISYIGVFSMVEDIGIFVEIGLE